ncbi:hypothetical protein K461DRAFT_138594 [Myriangium duriaei CBS 260.36]|uniref:Uncharacterized protein n=1 Tax=Myriangium duriaei CBS 260.36 TaxID=1168546 RepID=A0A9P4J177_9PEZI|nr:hypothetical protein K461DRAFT_138594 [Myriangium duriaei CBS 260.36]
MPDFMTRFFNRRKDCEAQRINLQEDHEVTKAIQKYVHGHRSEADVAILGRRRKAWKGKPTDGDTLILNIIRDIDIRLKERSRRMARPAALRQLGICYPLLARRRKKVPTVQLVPNRRHASSGYPYPDWFVEYGITREEWSAFISRIRQANRITPGQSALLFAIAIACEVFFFLPLLPFKLFAPCGAVVLPMYLASKRRKLRHAVNSGLIPVWTAAWNKTFFGPKGLCVGFDLPGPMFNDTFVHPKRKPLPWMRVLKGPLRRPMTPERAAHRARITIARVRSPAPKEGRVPLIDPIKIPRMQHCRLMMVHSRP